MHFHLMAALAMVLSTISVTALPTPGPLALATRDETVALANRSTESMFAEFSKRSPQNPNSYGNGGEDSSGGSGEDSSSYPGGEDSSGGGHSTNAGSSPTPTSGRESATALPTPPLSSTSCSLLQSLVANSRPGFWATNTSLIFPYLCSLREQTAGRVGSRRLPPTYPLLSVSPRWVSLNIGGSGAGALHKLKRAVPSAARQFAARRVWHWLKHAICEQTLYHYRRKGPH
ncbi:hypothetical protein BV25DRAFT_1127123 [Artomyces pyxidatus]|uniref:Uncharacterized protein n=1 Tax=Artomyces pyxidatus TaxID=48021 RepID=A0ACB8STL0_9AGAM|nr:hypothetical protein BV25DRAFT_1127123 [Artomyces pyxidatus]